MLGRTPINLHFKTGNTYELMFVKRGYNAGHRATVAVNNTKDRKRRGDAEEEARGRKKRSFFHPHR